MITLSKLAIVALIAPLLATGCAVQTEDGEPEPASEDELAAGEEVGTVTEALATQPGSGGTSTGSWCTSCGCRLEYRGKDDFCRYYACVCDTAEEAECAAKKRSAASAAALSTAN